MPPYTLARYYCYVLFGLSAISMSAAASTPDGFAVGYGVDESGLSVDAVQAAAFWDWDVQWLRYKDWQLDLTCARACGEVANEVVSGRLRLARRQKTQKFPRLALSAKNDPRNIADAGRMPVPYENIWRRPRRLARFLLA